MERKFGGKVEFTGCGENNEQKLPEKMFLHQFSGVKLWKKHPQTTLPSNFGPKIACNRIVPSELSRKIDCNRFCTRNWSENRLQSILRLNCDRRSFSNCLQFHCKQFSGQILGAKLIENVFESKFSSAKWLAIDLRLKFDPKIVCNWILHFKFDAKSLAIEFCSWNSIRNFLAIDLHSNFDPKFACSRICTWNSKQHSRAIDFSLQSQTKNRMQSKLHPKFDPRFAFNQFCTWNFLSPAQKNSTLPQICTQDQPTALLLYYSAKSVGVLTQLCGTHPHPVPEDSLFPYFIQKYEFLRLNLKFPFLINIFLVFFHFLSFFL